MKELIASGRYLSPEPNDQLPPEDLFPWAFPPQMPSTSGFEWAGIGDLPLDTSDFLNLPPMVDASGNSGGFMMPSAESSGV
jgi:hypothetical protein